MTAAGADDPPDHADIALPEPRANRPVTLAHRAEYALVVSLCFVFRLIGVDAASALAGGFCRIVGPRLGKINHRARINLKIAFPDWPDAAINAVIKDVWENLGRTAGEFAHLSAFNPALAKSRVIIEGRDLFDDVIARGEAAIFVTGHFANWEVLGVATHHIGLNYAPIYRAANNPLVDGFIIRERAKAMSRRLIPKGKRGGRDMIKAIKNGVSLGILVDQKLTSGGIASPFFGKTAMTAPAAARLALKYNLPVIPVDIERLGGAHFKLSAHSPMTYTPTGDSRADTKAVTDRINLEIERMIRARPGQWLWLHRRWPKKHYVRD